MALRNIPLHVRSRVIVAHDHLMGTIDHELQKLSDALGVCSCDVVLTREAHGGYRAAVALELDGGRCISQSSASPDVEVAITEAFTACRAQASASAE